MPLPITRRAALGLLASAGGAALPLARPTRAAAQFTDPPAAGRATRFRSIGIDTSRLARLGNPASADRLAADLARQMRAVFGDIVAPRDPGGATLVARISSLSLASYTGTRSYGGGRGGDASGQDYLEGSGVVVVGGRMLSETPILSALDPSYSGAWYLPDIDARRVDSIAYHFSWWLRREMGV